jgi:hypothetical protein
MLKKIKILDAKVPLYCNPDLKSRIPGFLKKNEILAQIKKYRINGDNWRKIRLFKQNAYIHNADVFEFVSARILRGKIIVHSQPSNDSRIMKLFQIGKSFLISEELKDWYEIRFYGDIEEIGFVEKTNKNGRIKINKSSLDLGWLRDIEADHVTIWSFLGLFAWGLIVYGILPDLGERIQYTLFFLGVFGVFFLIEKIIRKNT